MYQGDNPFFVLVSHIYSNDESGVFSIQLTFTTCYSQLREFEDQWYFKYNQDNIYVLARNFQGDSLFRSRWINRYNASRITSSVLMDEFYPLTEDAWIDDLNANKMESITIIVNDDFCQKKDRFDVLKMRNKVTAMENGFSINYFTNYCSSDTGQPR